MPRAAPSVAELLADLAAVLRHLGARWYLFGAQALVVRGLPRSTADVDVTVLWMSQPTSVLVEALARGGFDLLVTRPSFLATTRVVPVRHRRTGIPVDVVLGGSGLEEIFAERAEKMRVGRAQIPVASATDMLVMKMIAGRPKDLEDARSLMATGSVDQASVEDSLRAFCDAVGESDALDRWRSLPLRARATTPKRKPAKATSTKARAGRRRPV